ncbi:MAG: SDR family NAD(P)-dependent oxidoreductase, partial [Bifidobacteriaceae bacterium]|nr:SDR family NAD(P)-dependent oxidoreductase [Bifidobacteriaceae bacterium]
MEIEGKVAWITGGTAGMGLATAKLLLGKGAKVMVSARDAERGQRVADELGPNCVYVQAAVEDAPAMERAVATLIDKWGRIDVLFANAGGGVTSWCLPMAPTPESVASGGPLEWAYTEDGPATLESFKINIGINLVGAFDAARLAAWEMRRNEPNADGERGVIVFTSSISATKRHSPGFNCGYSAGKAGLLGLAKEIACNLAPLGIRV